MAMMTKISRNFKSN